MFFFSLTSNRCFERKIVQYFVLIFINEVCKRADAGEERGLLTPSEVEQVSLQVKQ